MEAQYSGISEYTYNLINNLLKIDRQNQYFLFYNTAQAATVPKFNFPNVEIKEFQYPNKLFNLSMRFLKLPRIDKMIGGVDILLIPNFLFLNLSKKCKQVLVVHDLSFELYPEFFTPKKKLWHKLINARKLCREADIIVAISENTKNDIINLYNVGVEKIKTVNPGISDLFFQSIREEDKIRIKEKYNLADDYVFYLGNLEPRKNLEALIKAFAELKNQQIKLVIAGGEAWKYKKIYKLWQNSPVRKRIKFLGYIDAADRPFLYAAAKIFVYPSIYEGFGLPPIEAMACGTPVITSFSSSLPEAVSDAGLLIDPNNYKELAQTIDELLNNPLLINQLSKKGLQRSKQFSWDNSAKKILEIINDL
ncbi:MAG: hypothetical protein A3J62_01310 [Candidatus Buchananbacteria bacterium RIFCSPHIGHO2_02_FULL_38_8]|uniref:Glycosyl transferase family 1 domain-containing protein n=1 Tax=Candidatus Buchananbacteria bacterium RIFCSPHIGHO2_02_FULL_38_8 TaxID=1797538 RepID=A0A1G1Y667_9BACT|nr:MAG: hypothetical protein A3J62_01310 [Candidatus Buchananbacteria bacterium RIFCSPHIGHO2_02_FULL_38_8]